MPLAIRRTRWPKTLSRINSDIEQVHDISQESALGLGEKDKNRAGQGRAGQRVGIRIKQCQ